MTDLTNMSILALNFLHLIYNQKKIMYVLNFKFLATLDSANELQQSEFIVGICCE